MKTLLLLTLLGGGDCWADIKPGQVVESRVFERTYYLVLVRQDDCRLLAEDRDGEIVILDPKEVEWTGTIVPALLPKESAK